MRGLVRLGLFVGSVLVLASPAVAQFEVRAGGFGVLSKRNASFAGDVGTGSATMTGFDLAARYRYLGLSARLLGGSFTADSGTSAAGKIANGDLSLSGGIPEISAVLGYGRRGFTGALGSTSWSFIEFGARSTLSLGSTGLQAFGEVMIYGGVKGASGGAGSGKAGETALLYAPSRVPIYVMLGYRIEQFTATGGSGDQPEEVSGIVLGGGVRFGW